MRKERAVFSSSLPRHIPPRLMERNSEKRQEYLKISTSIMLGKVPGYNTGGRRHFSRRYGLGAIESECSPYPLDLVDRGNAPSFHCALPHLLRLSIIREKLRTSLSRPTQPEGKEGPCTLNGYSEHHRLPNMFSTGTSHTRITMTAYWLMRYLSIGLHGPRSR